MPLIRRLPKRGFSNSLFRVEYEAVNVDRLAQFSGETITLDLLKQRGLLKKRTRRFKVLGGGELDVPLTVDVAHAFEQASARAKIEAAGGSLSIVEAVISRKRRDDSA